METKASELTRDTCISNISGKLRESIEGRFRSGFVGKNVFDEALIEVYNVMQSGPFYRFIKTKAFQEYAKANADFSLLPATRGTVYTDEASTSKSIIPVMDSMQDDNLEMGNHLYKGALFQASQGTRFDVVEYVHSL